MGDRLTLHEARGEFDLDGLAYLDTPSQGVPTRAGADALARAVEAWRAGRADYEAWEADADAARAAVAALLGVPPADLALVPTVGVAAALLATSVDRAVVAPEPEYRSNLYPWLARRDVRLVDGDPLTDAVVDAIDDGVGVVAVSSVQAVDGRAVDVARIAEAAHAHGALVFVDATQALGAAAAGLAATGADVVVAAGYKFLLGGRGSGYLYVRPELQERLEPLAPGPRAAADGGAYGPPYRLAGGAARFDQSIAWHAWPPARAGAELLAAVGAEALQRHATGLVDRVRAGLAERGLADRVAPAEGPTPIVSVRCDDADAVVAALAADGVRVAARGAGIRAGFHLFNDTEHADRLVAGLAAAIGRGAT